MCWLVLLNCWGFFLLNMEERWIDTYTYIHAHTHIHTCIHSVTYIHTCIYAYIYYTCMEMKDIKIKVTSKIKEKENKSF